MVLFDVVSLFTNLLLGGTMNLILRNIYEKTEIVIDIPKCEICELLYICTKNMHFMFKNKI